MLYNITCSLDNNKIDKKRLLKALEISQFLPNFKETNIIEKLDSISIDYDGKGLSGGERQRIIIAQAIYLKPYFLLIDEGLCALKSLIAQKVSNNLYYSDIPCIFYISHNDVNLDLWSNTITLF